MYIYICIVTKIRLRTCVCMYISTNKPMDVRVYV